MIGIAKQVEALFGRPLPGQVMKAGRRLRACAGGRGPERFEDAERERVVDQRDRVRRLQVARRVARVVYEAGVRGALCDQNTRRRLAAIGNQTQWPTTMP